MSGEKVEKGTVFSKRRMSQYAFNTVIGAAPYILWSRFSAQDFLDTQENVSYTADK